MNEIQELRLKAYELSSKHAKLYFSKGHEGSEHCPCEMAKEVRRLNAEADALREKRKALIKCPTCGGTGKATPPTSERKEGKC